MEQKFVTGGNGLKLYIEESGNPAGQALLFLHGWSQSLVAWNKQVNSELAQTYRLICVDSRGHGKSEKPAGMEAYMDSKLWADDVAAVINELKLVKPIIVGWSYGGAIIADYIQFYGQDNIAGLCMVSPTCHVGTEEAIGLLNPAALGVAGGLFSNDTTENMAANQQFVRLMTYNELSSADTFMLIGAQSVVPIHVRQALLGRTLDSNSVLATITLPTLLVQGEQDGAVSTRATERLHEIIKGSTLQHYPNTGHIAALEQPTRFNAELDQFAKQVTA